MSNHEVEHSPQACCGACEFAAAVEADPALAPVNTKPEMVAAADARLQFTGICGGRPINETFRQPVVTIGRALGNDLVVSDGSVSKYVCQITIAASGSVSIEDKNSACGTYINGRRIKAPTALRHGDVVMVGNVKLHVAVG